MRDSGAIAYKSGNLFKYNGFSWSIIEGTDQDGWGIHGCDGCCHVKDWQLASLRDSVVIANDLIIQHQEYIKRLEGGIKTYSNEGDMVLDNTMGVGTTCLGAKELNRSFIGIEKEVKYYEFAVGRVFGQHCH